MPPSMSFTHPQGSSAPATPPTRYSRTEGGLGGVWVGEGVREQRQPPTASSKNSSRERKNHGQGRARMLATHSTTGE
jgi:hypothetical protein